MIWDEFLRHFRFCDEEDSGLSDEEQERKGPKNRPKHTRKRIHQAKKNFLEKFKTASNTQEKELKAMFPHKNIYYFDFPSLVNSTIITGQSSPLELAGKNNYVLYFGRIEKYKGVDLAYRVFTESTALKNVTLVIAGSGDIYFPRNLNKEDNIIFINRYINDDEVAYLFKNALVIQVSQVNR